MPALTPREIVSELNRHIVGQDAAKRAVALALRTRWRRMQLAPELRNEVAPKNILMIGPTGVGKTRNRAAAGTAGRCALHQGGSDPSSPRSATLAVMWNRSSAT